jgi:hypothetical protein
MNQLDEEETTKFLKKYNVNKLLYALNESLYGKFFSTCIEADFSKYVNCPCFKFRHKTNIVIIDSQEESHKYNINYDRMVNSFDLEHDFYSEYYINIFENEIKKKLKELFNSCSEIKQVVLIININQPSIFI